MADDKCPNGHPWTDENTRWRERQHEGKGRSRVCRACNRDYMREYARQGSRGRVVEMAVKGGWELSTSEDGRVRLTAPPETATVKARSKRAARPAAEESEQVSDPSPTATQVKPPPVVRVDNSKCPDCGKWALVDHRVVMGPNPYRTVRGAQSCGCLAGSPGAERSRDFLDRFHAANPKSRWYVDYPAVCGPSPATLIGPLGTFRAQA